MRLPFLVLLFSVWSAAIVPVAAQDPVFSQFYAAPLQTNPAFAGSAFAPRMGLAYRNQWTGFSNAYRTYAVWYEQRLDPLNSGIGFYLQGDNAGDGIMRTNTFHTQYSYQLQAGQGLNLHLGIEAGARQQSLNWAALVFPDQLDPLKGNVITTRETAPDARARVLLDIGAGLLATGQRWHFGFSARHLNQADQRFLLVNDELVRGLPLFYSVSGGADLFVKKRNKNSDGSFLSPNFLFAAQGSYCQLNVGTYASVGVMFFGAWYRTTFRNSDAAILLAGFRQGVFKLGISYDATISGLAGSAGSTFEMTMGVLLDQSETLKKKRKRANMNDCLRMFQ
jgi:type IX secretion system PorP/SprF family membrane protein